MIEHSKLLTNSSPAIHKPLITADANTSLSAELLWVFITQSNLVDIAWRRAVPPLPASSEIEHQKMAFLQKLVEVVRKSSTAKLSTNSTEDGQDVERSTKIAPNSSN